MYTHLSRSVFLTGILSPPVVINSLNTIKTSEYSVQMKQDININRLYIQGGPGRAVSELKKKVIEGSIKVIPRISESNTLEPGVINLIDFSQDYKSFFSLSSFLLPYNTNLTAESSPYIANTNSLVFDVCIVDQLTISAKKEGNVEMQIGVKGQTDIANTSPLTYPEEDLNLYRNLTWYDCFFERDGSQLENVYSIEITIKKDIDQTYFLGTNCGAPPNTFVGIDRPFSTGVSAVGVNFKIVEHITSLYDIFSFSFGGFYNDINLDCRFGPIRAYITNALLNISTQNLSPDLIERTTEGFFRMSPDTPENSGFLFSIIPMPL